MTICHLIGRLLPPVARLVGWRAARVGLREISATRPSAVVAGRAKKWPPTRVRSQIRALGLAPLESEVGGARAAGQESKRRARTRVQITMIIIRDYPTPPSP